MNDIKEIVVLSGKGGTGKTTISLNLLKKFEKKIIADADVDASDMFIVLEPEIQKQEKFKGKSIAKLIETKCTGCRICEKLCRFDAISFIKNKNIIHIDENSCDGCTLCSIACPTNAIYMEEQIVGEWYISDTAEGLFSHAKLFPGAENSGNLVTMVKQNAKNLARENNIPFIIVDGPPGIGCPVISALSGANYILIVTEPTLSGLNDLYRLKELIEHFKIKYGIIINKADINFDIVNKIENFALENNIDILEKINFDKCIINALNNKKFAYNECKTLKEKIDNIYDKIMNKIKL